MMKNSYRFIRILLAFVLCLTFAFTNVTANADVTTGTDSSAITIDGYYDDWANIDQDNAFTWYSNNKLCTHIGGIIMDDEYVYVHVKVNPLYTAQIPVANYILTINGTTSVEMKVAFANDAGEIDWNKYGNIYNLPEGTNKLTLFYNGYPVYNMGDIDITVKPDEYTINSDGQQETVEQDEFEFRVSLESLSKITGIPVESINSISYSNNNLGGDIITTSGTPTYAAGGILLCLLITGVVLLFNRKKEKKLAAQK